MENTDIWLAIFGRPDSLDTDVRLTRFECAGSFDSVA
jgi:hypothetical protein